MRIVSCVPGTKGFDTSAKLTPDLCDRFVREGYRFAVRYLSLAGPQAGDLTRDELVAILDSGLGLMLVQHVLNQGWHPTASLGQQLGGAAVAHAQYLAIPPGMQLWCDLEGMAEGTTSNDALAFASSWGAQVIGAHFKAGGYCGAGVPLTGDQLFSIAPFSGYWDSQSANPNVSRRGFQMVQCFAAPLGSMKVCGIDVDVDFTQNDYRGDAPLMLVAD